MFSGVQADTVNREAFAQHFDERLGVSVEPLDHSLTTAGHQRAFRVLRWQQSWRFDRSRREYCGAVDRERWA